MCCGCWLFERMFKTVQIYKKKKKMNRNPRWRHKWIKYWTNQNAEADLEVDLEVGGQLNCPPHMQGIVWCFLSLRWMNVLVRDFSVKGLKGIEKQNTRAHTHTHTHTQSKGNIQQKKNKIKKKRWGKLNKTNKTSIVLSGKKNVHGIKKKCQTIKVIISGGGGGTKQSREGGEEYF